ncbi:hypothetical protein NEIRO03_2149 [Nematocida sp. AWRm78]|nr:hypothetical protein NEIRO02_2114 [Nematocida sp. AWRm79]KAI5185918.1 hypothetical protein NEIRO03_2149 [Nematocida sp. AWRm78]
MKPFLLIKCLGYGLNRTLVINSNSLIGVQFTQNILPIISNSNEIITNNEFITVNYRIKLSGTCPLSIESGLHIANVIAANNEMIDKRIVYNRPIIPDFTTPYLVFGICGGVIVSIISAFSKVLLHIV